MQRQIAFFLLLAITACTKVDGADTGAQRYRFQPTPQSLKHYQVPQWYQDAKFGIYFHWAPFSVPAYKTEWYPHWMYNPPEIKRRKAFADIPQYHVKHYGPLNEFGYKDFIPMFRAEKWDPQAWVRLFKEAGAKWLVSAAVHHDGFALWNSKHIPFNAAVMGPKRDIVGEYLNAVRRAGLKTGVATHYGRHWRYYTFRPEYDTWDPRYEGLYGHRREDNDPPRPEDEQHWEDVMLELIDNYHPDYIYVDGGIGDGERIFKKPYFRQQMYNVLAHYYNASQQWAPDGVVLTYKREFLQPDQAVEDFERRGLNYIRRDTKWQTDDKIAVNGWCYVKNTDFWPVEYLIAALVDTVSKNGNFLLNVGPRPDGTLREQEVQTLKEIGAWLKVNGEAIYGTRPWYHFGYGKIERPRVEPGAVRFTTKGDFLYAICFGWPKSGVFVVREPASDHPFCPHVRSVQMLGVSQPIKWRTTANGLQVSLPERRPCKHAFVLKIGIKDGLPKKQ